MANTNLITHELGDKTIIQRLSDGYWNATKLCQAAEKRWGNYFQNESTLDFVNALSSDTGIQVSELIQAVKGGSGQQGTWVHPLVAVHLAQWLSPEFAVRVSKLVYAWTHSQQQINTCINPAQQNALQSIIADRVGDGSDAGKKRVYMWSRFNNHFKLGSYKQLPSTLFDEACDYLKAMPLTAKPMLALPDQTKNHLWLVLNDSGQVIESIPMNNAGEVRGQIDKHFTALALLDRQQVMNDIDRLNMLMIETTSRMRNTLNPLITVLGTKTNATQADTEAFWQARLNQSADKLRAISG